MMQVWLQTVTPFLPLAMGVVYGMAYAVNGYIFKHASLLPCMLVISGFNFILWLLFAYLSGGFKFSDLQKIPTNILPIILLTTCLTFIGWAMASYTMKAISPTYVAMGEISYVFFSPLFAYLIFSRKEVDTYTAIAGIFILIGCAILIYGKHVKQAAQVTGAS